LKVIFHFLFQPVLPSISDFSYSRLNRVKIGCGSQIISVPSFHIGKEAVAI